MLCLAACAARLSGASVGSGAPNAQIQQSFQNAFARGAFSSLVNATPLNDVHTLEPGSPALVQEFQSKANSSVRFALLKPDPNAPVSATDTLQIYGDIYSFYDSAAVVATAGYPTGDTTTCLSGTVVCDYQIFTKNYAIFAYSSPQVTTFTVTDPIYTEWSNNPALGIASAATSSVTSVAGTSGTQQLFANGAIFSYPVSSSSPSTYSVVGAVYTAYNSAGNYSVVGFPTSEDIVLASGLHRQTFEGGRIEYTAGSLPALLFPIAEIDIANAPGNVTLHAGASLTLTAFVYDSRGNTVTGRTLAWSTTNGSVATVQGNGASAVVQALGHGSASIFVTGEGKSSQPFNVIVESQCCDVGEGAPSPSITQAFQTAVARNHLAVTLPNATPVTQTGSGYVQIVSAAGSSYAISESSRAATAYIIGGSLYGAYLANGGFTGPLGFPSSDASAGGTQTFESGAALAGSPVQIVPVPIAAKWLQSGAETGSLGVPAAPAATFVSVTGVSGVTQAFGSATIYGITSGSHSGQAFVLSGLILARYLALNGTAGALGIPVSDPFFNGGVRTQNFEAGYIDLQPGATAAVEHFNPRKPAISATPSTVGPGGRVHIAISGFAFGANLTVTVAGQSSFAVTVAGGEFGWDVVVPAGAKAGPVAITVKAAGSSDAASGAYTITSFPLLQPALSAVSGDQQNGLPGSLLAAPLIAVLRDVNGNPMPGVAVTYAASPGAIAQGPALTDINGQISATLRLPLTSGVSAMTISAAARTVSFSALAAAGSLENFPALQADANGALTASLAALIRYGQNQSALGSPNGPATPASLAQFLNANNGYAQNVANPWVAMQFAGIAGGISVENTGLDHVRDLLNAGTPVLLDLDVQQDGVAAAGTSVDAIGVNADGSIAIADPNPAWARVVLDDYLAGFSAQGHTIQGKVRSALTVAPSMVAAGGFVVASATSAAASAAGPAGPCALADLDGVRFLECDGSQQAYQVAFGAQTSATVIDLGAIASAQKIGVSYGTAFQIARSNGGLQIQPQTIAVQAVVNAASGGPGLSPGGIFTIYGAGLTVGTSAPTVKVAGQTATVLAAFPFQVNAVMPVGVPAGNATLEVDGALGNVTQSVTIAAVAPAIFLLGSTQGAILNQDATINSVFDPVPRGQFISIYCTGLGVTSKQGVYDVTVAPVAVTLNGIALKPSFAGLTPGIPGLYQVNVQIPASADPGAQASLTLSIAGQNSNVVEIAIE